MKSQLVRRCYSAIVGTLPPSVQIKLSLQRHVPRASDRRWIMGDLREYVRQEASSPRRMQFPVTSPLFPVYWDRDASAGQVGGHYFWADLISAQKIFQVNPIRHIDVGSSPEGFVAHVASFRQVEVIDIRPLAATIPNVIFHQADLFRDAERWAGSTDSLSCLSVLEHFGLGRYGDTVDYDAWASGLSALRSMLKLDGLLYLSVPTGEPQRTEFNAHRVFSFSSLRDYLVELFEIDEVYWVDDDGGFSVVDWRSPAAEISFGATYGCSIWVLRRTTI